MFTVEVPKALRFKTTLPYSDAEEMCVLGRLAFLLIWLDVFHDSDSNWSVNSFVASPPLFLLLFFFVVRMNFPGHFLHFSSFSLFLDQVFLPGQFSSFFFCFFLQFVCRLGSSSVAFCLIPSIHTVLVARWLYRSLKEKG